MDHMRNMFVEILLIYLRVARPDRNRLVHVGWLARRIDAMLWPGRIFLESLKIEANILAAEFFSPRVLNLSRCDGLSRNKEFGENCVQIPWSIVGWELENLNKFKNQNQKSICDFVCSCRYPNSPFEWFAFQVLPQALPTRHIPKVAKVRPNPVVVVLLVLVHPNLIIMLR